MSGMELTEADATLLARLTGWERRGSTSAARRVMQSVVMRYRSEGQTAKPQTGSVVSAGATAPCAR